MFCELQEIDILFARESVEVNRKETSCRVIHVDLEEEFVVFEGGSVTSLFTQNIDEFEYGHKEASRVLVVNNVLLDEGLFDELQQVISPSHLVDVYNSLNEVICFPVVAL